MEVPRYSDLEDYNCSVPPVQRPVELLPEWFPVYLELTAADLLTMLPEPSPPRYVILQNFPRGVIDILQ